MHKIRTHCTIQGGWLRAVESRLSDCDCSWNSRRGTHCPMSLNRMNDARNAGTHSLCQCTRCRQGFLYAGPP